MSAKQSTNFFVASPEDNIPERIQGRLGHVTGDAFRHVAAQERIGGLRVCLP